MTIINSELRLASTAVNADTLDKMENAALNVNKMLALLKYAEAEFANDKGFKNLKLITNAKNNYFKALDILYKMREELN
jgi:hypothetical protein